MTPQRRHPVKPTPRDQQAARKQNERERRQGIELEDAAEKWLRENDPERREKP